MFIARGNLLGIARSRGPSCAGTARVELKPHGAPTERSAFNWTLRSINILPLTAHSSSNGLHFEVELGEEQSAIENRQC
jgi:hypothetical protein